MSQRRQRIRIAVDIASQGTLIDQITGLIPTFVRGTDVQLELAFFNNGVLIDISSWGSVTATVKDINALDGPNLAMEVSGSAELLPESGQMWNTSLALSNWQAGTDQHCIVVFTSADTNIYMSNPQGFYYLVLTVQSSFTNSPGTPTSIIADSSTTTATITFPSSISPFIIAGDAVTTNSSTSSLNVTGAAIVSVGLNTIQYALPSPVAGGTSATGSLTTLVTLTTNQQVGFGQASFGDIGVTLPPPSAVFTPTYLTQAMGDARYVQTLFSTAGLAPKASPTFSGTVTLPTQTNTTPGLLIPPGTLLTVPETGSIEFDGTNLYYTTSGSVTRLTLATVQELAGYALLTGANFSGNISAGTINASSYFSVGGVKVVGTPSTSIGSPASVGGAPSAAGWGFSSSAQFNTFVTNTNTAITAFNLLLAALRGSTGHGLLLG